MAKKALANAHCLLEVIDRAPMSALRAFSTLDECQGLIRGFDWTQDEADLPVALKHHVANLKKDQRASAEREAMRVLRLATPESAQILTQVAQQLDDVQHRTFHQQEGGEIGRAIWIRTASCETARLFDAAESILNAADFRGCRRLYDAFDVPCADPPPFIWNDDVRKDLEAQLTQSMRLRDSCEVIYVPLVADAGGEAKTTHYLIVRFAGDQVQAMEVVNRNRRSFWYYPARDATLVYSPEHRRIEVCAHTLSTRQPLANVLSKHGFKVPLSSKPLNRSCYDLSRFAQSLLDVKPVVGGVKIERLRLTSAEALIGHHTDSVKPCRLRRASRASDAPCIAECLRTSDSIRSSTPSTLRRRPARPTSSRAFYWQQLLDSGTMQSGSAIARAEKLHQSVINELLRLTLLAPDIIEQWMAGRQPRRLTLMWFQRNRLPVDWQAQRKLMASFEERT